MKNAVQLFVAIIGVICLSSFTHDNNINPMNSTLSINVFADLDEQGVIVKQRPGGFIYKCDCGTVLILRGLTPRGVPFVKQLFKSNGETTFRELKLEEGAATNGALIWTCDDICNGLAPFAN
ncbi:MAG: hypothetical protein HOP11_07475 [Saprospiraceae bacterium]|nr:hypothetical protein [Saprospiraceae bacterium]